MNIQELFQQLKDYDSDKNIRENQIEEAQNLFKECLEQIAKEGDAL